MWSNNICIECLGTVCKCNQHYFVSYSYRGRVPKADAHKKEWKQFIELFLSYDKEIKAKALKTLENKGSVKLSGQS